MNMLIAECSQSHHSKPKTSAECGKTSMFCFAFVRQKKKKNPCAYRTATPLLK